MRVIFRIALFVASALLVTACDPHGFYLGRAVPNSRVEVTLETALPPNEIYRVFSGLAADNGFPFLYGEPVDPNGKPRRYYGWIERDERTRKTVSGVSIFWDDQPESVQVFTFEYSAPFKQKSFYAEDWLVSENWRTELIPDAFPNADIRILVHPAEHTNTELVQSISEETGIVVPPEIVEKMERRRRERGQTQ